VLDCIRKSVESPCLEFAQESLHLVGDKKKSSPKPFDFELLAMPVVGVSRALSNSPQG